MSQVTSVKGQVEGWLVILVLVFVLSFFVLYPRWHGASWRTQLKLAGGQSAKMPFKIVAEAIQASASSKEFGINLVTEVSSGAEENISKLCDDRDGAMLGLILSYSQPPCDGLTAIADMFKSTLHIIATRQSGITTLFDLTPQTRVALGPDKSGTAKLAKDILEFYELPYETVNVATFDDEINKLSSKEVDVAFLFTFAPARILQDLGRRGELRLLSIPHPEGMLLRFPHLVRDEIPIGAYGGNPLLPDVEVTTVAGAATLAVSPTLGSAPGAKRIIERITRAIFEAKDPNLVYLAASMYKDKDFAFARGDGVPKLHEGAKRFYEHPLPLSATEFAVKATVWIIPLGGIVTLLMNLGKLLPRRSADSSQGT